MGENYSMLAYSLVSYVLSSIRLEVGEILQAQHENFEELAVKRCKECLGLILEAE